MESIRQRSQVVGLLAAAILALGAGCATTQATTQAPARAQALTRTSAEAPGPNCAMGGSKIEVGPDRNTNQTLDHDEVTGAVFACNGPNGALIEASTLPAGDANCALGGIEVRSGTDANANGQLEAGEYERNYSCNVATGTSGGG